MSKTLEGVTRGRKGACVCVCVCSVFPHENILDLTDTVLIDDLGVQFFYALSTWRVRTLGLLPAFNCRCVAVAPLIAPQAVCPKTMTILAVSEVVVGALAAVTSCCWSQL